MIRITVYPDGVHQRLNRPTTTGQVRIVQRAGHWHIQESQVAAYTYDAPRWYDVAECCDRRGVIKLAMERYPDAEFFEHGSKM